MPGTFDDLMDWLSGAKALRKAAGQPDKPTPSQPTTPGMTQQDIGAEAEKSAAAMRAKKAKQTPGQSVPARSGAQKYGDSGGYDWRKQ